jgi:hypothetical protein
LIQHLYEEVAREEGCREDLREYVPEKREYEGAPDLRGVERVSVMIGTREVIYGVDSHTKLGEIAEFDWDGLALSPPCLEVSWWENTLKSRLMRRITQHLEDNLWCDNTFLYGIEKEAYAGGVEMNMFHVHSSGFNWDWFVHAGLQQREVIEVFHKIIAYSAFEFSK